MCQSEVRKGVLFAYRSSYCTALTRAADLERYGYFSGPVCASRSDLGLGHPHPDLQHCCQPILDFWTRPQINTGSVSGSGSFLELNTELAFFTQLEILRKAAKKVIFLLTRPLRGGGG